MLKTCSVLLLVLGLGTVFFSCEKLPSGPTVQPGQGQLAWEKITFQGAIPMDYGNLVGVIPHVKSEKWAALWFERPDKTISVVWVNVVDGYISEKVTKIPRK